VDGLTYGHIGQADATTHAGVDYPGVAFLLRTPFDGTATVFAFRACYRNLSPARFQLWRPTSGATSSDNRYQLITEVIHRSESELRQLPTIETVSLLQLCHLRTVVLSVRGR